MRKIFIIFLLLLLLNCKTTQPQEDNNQEGNKIENFSITILMSEKTNLMDLPDQNRINIISYILQSTKEINSNQISEENVYDISHWLELSNISIDPVLKIERYYQYTYNLNLGIQKYIFNGRKNKIKNINISNLNEEELKVIKLFNYIIFNEEFLIKLTDEHMDKLETDRNYYWDYFNQIHKLFGVE